MQKRTPISLRPHGGQGVIGATYGQMAGPPDSPERYGTGEKGMNDDPRLKLKIRLCCDAMGDAVMMNDIRESIIQDEDSLFICWSDGDTMPLNYCPACGRKIEVKEEEK